MLARVLLRPLLTHNRSLLLIGLFCRCSRSLLKPLLAHPSLMSTHTHTRTHTHTHTHTHTGVQQRGGSSSPQRNRSLRPVFLAFIFIIEFFFHNSFHKTQRNRSLRPVFIEFLVHNRFCFHKKNFTQRNRSLRPVCIECFFFS